MASVLVAVLVIPSASVAQRGARLERPSGDKLKAAIDAHAHDFDYLLGTWSFTGENERGKFSGVWKAVRLEGGPILDEFRVLGDSGETLYYTATLRAYNAHDDRWEYVSTESGSGLLKRATARRVGSEMHIEQTFDDRAAGRVVVSRIRYYNIQPGRFSWIADRSYDGGKTWNKDDQRIEARRTGPPADSFSLRLPPANDR